MVKFHFVPKKVNREHSEPKPILLKLLNYTINFLKCLRHSDNKSKSPIKNENKKKSPDFFKAVILDCSQVMVFPRKKRMN